MRASLGENDSWDQPAYRDPAPRVDWTKDVSVEPKAAIALEVVHHDYDDDDLEEETGPAANAPVVAAAGIGGGTFFGGCAHSQAAYRRAALTTGVGLVVAIAALAPL